MSYLSDMKGKISSWLGAAADVLLPRVCTVCGDRLLLSENDICLPCLADMPLTRFWTMEHNPMADRFNRLIQKSLDESVPDGSMENLRPRERYAFAAALLIYKDGSGYKNIPQQLKYHGNIEVGRHFGRMLGRKLASSELFQDVDLVMPVPLHWMRRWQRGYNQAEVLAGEVASALGARMDVTTLIRHRRTSTQTKLGVEEKAANVKGAFKVSDASAEAKLHPDMKGSLGTKLASVRHILLIDDIFTTGSTLMACFTALRTVFPPSVRISVATLGFVGGA